MYKRVLRPLFFEMSPEAAHNLIAWFLKATRYVPFAGAVMRKMFCVKGLEREVFGLKFRNPIGMAAGFDKNGEFYRELSNLGFGFVEVGTVTPLAQPGNPKPRSFRLPDDQALVNRMGFNNTGVESMVERLKKRKQDGVIVGGNLGKNSATPNDDAPKDYLALFEALYDYVDYFVINVSCPNVQCLTDLQSKQGLLGIVGPLVASRAEKEIKRPILLKISPDLTPPQVDDALEVVEECVLDGIVATNTTTSREGLSSRPELIEKIGNGGLSGKPLTERAVEMVRYIYSKTEGKLPIIGVGGVMTPADAGAMLDAGASLVQVYTGFIYEGPAFVKRVNKYLKQR